MIDIGHQHAKLEGLGRRLGQLMGGDIGMTFSTIAGDISQLYPEELAAISRAVPARQREFATGRVNARLAMSRIGEPPAPVPCGTDRAPIWPDHLSGSISHTDAACVAVVARRSSAPSLGIDLEHDQPLPPDLWPAICTPAEAEDIRSRAIEDQGRWVTRLFSAKEAVYKWQYPLSGRMLDFQQIRLTWISNEPEARFIADLEGMPALRPPLGRTLTDAGLVVSWVHGA